MLDNATSEGHIYKW